jgi:hypothetical protein
MKNKKTFVGLDEMGLFLFLEDVISLQELLIFLGNVFQAVLVAVSSISHAL